MAYTCDLHIGIGEHNCVVFSVSLGFVVALAQQALTVEELKIQYQCSIEWCSKKDFYNGWEIQL